VANDAGGRVTPAVVAFTDTEQVIFLVHSSHLCFFSYLHVCLLLTIFASKLKLVVPYPQLQAADSKIDVCIPVAVVMV